ncbi:MAG: hypothetical protein PW788_14000 [Micavibrio sp.]|nr:hypothetical protein [Micavibrio sp.]
MTTEATATKTTGLRFDFNKAVEDARRDFPEETKNVTFIDLDAPTAAASMSAFFDSLTPAQQEVVESNRRYDVDFMTPEQAPSVWFAGDGRSLFTAYGSRTTLAENEKIFYPEENMDKQNYFTFQHELGHIVVKDGNRPNNRSEHGSDTFALLRGFKSGFFNKLDALKISLGRDTLAWYNADVTHISSMSLDALVINPKQIDFISLTPQETAKIAATHADTFSLNADMGSYLRLQRALDVPFYSAADARIDRLNNLGGIAMSADKDSHAFYFAARVLKTAFEQKQQGNPALENVEFSGEGWQQVWDAIEKKTKGRDLGATKAAQNPDIAPAEKQGFFSKLRTRITPLKI